MKLSDIAIDPEFRDLLPPLTDEQREGLLASIIRDKKFREPIVTWLNHGILLDGHHRHEIWQTAFGGDEDEGPEITEMHFPDRDAAKEWILRTQIARRNLTDAQRIEVALKLKPVIAAKARGQQTRKSVSLKSEKQKPIDTTAEIAKAAGKSSDSVRKVEAVLEAGTPELQEAMRAGTVSINTAAQAAKLPPTKQAEVVKSAAVSKAAASKSMRIYPPSNVEAPAVEPDAEIGFDGKPLPLAKGVGVTRGYEAVDILKRIPKNDVFRERAFQIVKDYIKEHSTGRRIPQTDKGDVLRAEFAFEKTVTRLLNNVKKSSTDALDRLPRLSNELRSLAARLNEYADEVDAKHDAFSPATADK